MRWLATNALLVSCSVAAIASYPGLDRFMLSEWGSRMALAPLSGATAQGVQRGLSHYLHLSDRQSPFFRRVYGSSATVTFRSMVSYPVGLAACVVLMSPLLSWLLTATQHGLWTSFAVRGLMRGSSIGLAVATLIVWSEVVSHLYVRLVGKDSNLRKLRNVGSMFAPLLVITLWLNSFPLLTVTRSVGRAIASSTVSLQLPDLSRLLVVACSAVVMMMLWISTVRQVE